jgi:endonuclease/exonuclease/phosphatase family metal-dependent hydrolase
MTAMAPNVRDLGPPFWHADAVCSAVRVVTWNVQGSHGLDVAVAAELLRAARPDVVALQEVQRRQAARLARALEVASHRWELKHWPLVHHAEGLAVLTPHRLVSSARFRLRRGPFWSWRRRIGIDATVDTGTVVVRLLDVHLSADDDPAVRVAEARLLVDRAGSAVPAPVIVGDLNDHPRDGAHSELVGAGWVDAWQRLHGDASGATNWTPGPRTGRPPTQRIDYVLAPSGSVIEEAAVLDGSRSHDEMGVLSDHLPLVVTVRLPEAGRAPR